MKPASMPARKTIGPNRRIRDKTKGVMACPTSAGQSEGKRSRVRQLPGVDLVGEEAGLGGRATAEANVTLPPIAGSVTGGDQQRARQVRGGRHGQDRRKA